MSTKGKRAYRPARLVQFAIWATLAVVIILVFPRSSYANAMGELNSTPTSATYQASGDVVAAGDTTGTAAELNASVVGNSPATATVEAYSDDSINLLPAYRWKNAVHLPAQLSAKDLVSSYGGEGSSYALAEQMFSIAGLVWGLLLSILRFAMSLDIVTAAAGSINDGFHRVADALGSAGMIVIVALVTIAAAVVSVTKKGGVHGGALRSVIGCILTLGLLQGFGAATAPDSANDDLSLRTPAGLAVLGNRYINEAGAAVASAFGSVDSLTASSRAGKTGGADTGLTTCDFYVQRLYANYEAVSANSGQSAITAKSLTMASFLWQRAIYDNWTVAAFGGTNNAKRIACHQMETNAGIDPQLQVAVVSDANATDPNVANLGGYNGMGVRAFYEMPEKKRQETAILAWAACDGTEMRPGWDTTHDAKNDDASVGGVSLKPCAAWFNTPLPANAEDMKKLRSGVAIGNDDVFHWSDQDDLRGETTSSTACDAADAGCTKSDLRNIHSVVMAYWGHNSGQKVMSGLMALVNSGVYAWAFGAAAAGTILTQFGLLFLLMILPWTLLMLAMPAKRGGGGGQATGRRLMRATVMFMAGKVMFVALLGVTMNVMTTLFDLVLGDDGLATKSALAAGAPQAASAGDTTVTQQAWGLVIPVVTIVVMNQITKALGLKGIMSFSGAAGFATAAAGHLGGDKGNMFNRGLQSGLSRISPKGLKDAKKGAKNLGSKVRDMASKARGSANAAGRKPGDLRSKATQLKSLMSDRKALKAPENADLRRAASVKGHRRLTKKEARAEARLRGEGLSPGLAEAVRAGRMSKQDAFVEQAKKATFKDGHPFTGEAKVDDISARERAARAGAYTLATAGRSAEDASAIRERMLTSELATAAAASRTDNQSGPVRADVAARAVSELRASTGLNYVGGTTGLPPLVVPSTTRVNGSANYAFPEFVVKEGDSEQVADEKRARLLNTLASPAALLAPKVLERRPAEAEDAYHARVTASTVAVGTLNSDGVHHNIRGELGLPDDGPALAAALDEIAAGRGRWADKLTERRRELSAADVATIDAFVASKKPDIDAMRLDAEKTTKVEAAHSAAVVKLARQMAPGKKDFAQMDAAKMFEAVEKLASGIDFVRGTPANAPASTARQITLEAVRALNLAPEQSRAAFTTLHARLHGEAQSLLDDATKRMEERVSSVEPQGPSRRRQGPGNSSMLMS